MKKYDFSTPEDIYRGLDLWMVNDALDDGEIARQVREFRDKGLYSVIFRTYNGLISDYPGPRFKHALRVAVDTARECGLRIAMQAGYMPSAFPALPKEHALHRIVPVPESEVTRDDRVIAVSDGIAYLDRIAPATVNMIDPASVEYYIGVAYEEMWSEFSDEFGKTLISVWLDEPRFDNRTLTWLAGRADEFAARFGYRLEAHIPSLYRDVGDFKRIRYDYFTFLRELMETTYYARVRAWCHARDLTFSGHLMGEEHLQMQIAQATALMPFYKYFDIPGIDVLRTNHDWYDHPMTVSDGITLERDDRMKHLGVLQCVSAAEQAGKAHILCEMYAITSPGFGFRDQMHLFDAYAANGINHQCMHALFYSPRGFRKRFYPQSFNVYEPFWKGFRHVKDYVARVSAFISRGRCAKDILVLHPLETAYGYYRGLTDPTDESPRKAIADYDRRFSTLLSGLSGAGVSYHLGDQPSLAELGSVEGDLLRFGEMRYRTVVLYGIEVLSSRVLALLLAFARAGGQILVCRGLPSRIDGCEDGRASALFDLPSVEESDSEGALIRTLRELSSRDFTYLCDGDASRLTVNRRNDGETNYFMLYNGDCRRELRGALRLVGKHSAALFSAETGELSSLATYAEGDCTLIPLDLPIGASRLVVTEPTDTLPSKAPEVGQRTLLPLRLTPETPRENVMTLELCTYKTENMQEFSDRPLAIERVVERLKREEYEGEVTLRFAFRAEAEIRDLRLVLEDPAECRVLLNGVPADTSHDLGSYYAEAFRTVPLPDAVRIGENVLELTRHTKPQVALVPSDDMKHLFELFRCPTGTDLERVHLLGDFRISALPEYDRGAGLVRIARDYALAPAAPLTRAVDLTAHGFPFYPGTVDYHLTVEKTPAISEAKEALLSVRLFGGCSVEVKVNGRTVGYIDRDPYTLSILPYLTEETNEITLRLYGTFRNLFGPSHLRGQDPLGCSRLTWWANYELTDCTDYDVGSHTNSFLLSSYGIEQASLSLL